MASVNNSYREFTLKNGLLVALQETSTQTVSGRLRVWHGSLNEHSGEEGLAHFLEHALMAGGSKRFSPEIADQVRGAFGSFNALTGLDKTFFPVDMLAEDAQLFLAYISDMVFNPEFDASKIEGERQRILRETADEKSSSEFKDNQELKEAFFGKNSPHAYFGLGSEAVVGSASVESLRNFHGQGYHPNNMDLILVGALPKNIDELVEQNFGSFKPGNRTKVEFPRNPPLQGAAILHTFAPELVNHDDPEQSSARLSILLVAPAQTDEDSYAVNMLVSILGGNAVSTLFTNVSQKKGLAYKLGAQYGNDNNTGTIHISGSIPSVRADEAIDAIFEEMVKLQAELVSQEILERLKRNARYSMAKVSETNAGRAYSIELMMDTGLALECLFERMEAVTPEKIMDAAVKYFPQSRADGKYVLMLRDPLKR